LKKRQSWAEKLERFQALLDGDEGEDLPSTAEKRAIGWKAAVTDSKDSASVRRVPFVQADEKTPVAILQHGSNTRP
jgi:hypothetical protein